MQHPNARLTVRGRLELVLLVEREGASFRAAAAAFRCSPSTAFEWVGRWRRHRSPSAWAWPAFAIAPRARTASGA